MIDSHAHLEMPEFNHDRKDVIQRAHDSGIDYIITIGIDIKSCKQAIALAEGNESIYAVLGIHPHNA
ncbi:MAG: TatD family hydrolase, partial [Deltaproteobacteria bacterium]|nr:TatD family hydrolase [Deltaproteobacteria bacterium]